MIDTKVDKHPQAIPLLAISGFANSGKTTLVCKLLTELSRQGYKVATIKHDGRDHIDEVKGTDSWLHQQAGAAVVAVTSGSKIITSDYRSYSYEEQFNRALSQIRDVDLILVEGFKHLPLPRIFLLRDNPDLESQLRAVKDIPMLGALAIDSNLDLGLELEAVTVYDINDITLLSQYIIDTFLNK